MSYIDQAMPVLSDAFVPPVVLGTANLTTFAFEGNDHAALVQRIDQADRDNSPAADEAAQTYDSAIAALLAFRRAEGLNLQDAALEASQIYRVGNPANPTLRLLALVGPGDLMVNTPLDFLTNHLDVRLDLLYLLPHRPLPPLIPNHDLAFFAISDADPATLLRLRRLYINWPRPALNDPRFLPTLERDALARSLADVPGICSPRAIGVARTALMEHLRTGHPIDGFAAPDDPYPCLIRPRGSHAGSGLALVRTATELAEYLRFSFERQFFVTAFEDYRSPDGLYRKSRIAFIDGRPFLCHMALSTNWMVHYLNADMTASADRRAQEAAAMQAFDDGFARRHQAAFEALHRLIGFDYYSIDCAETRDGRLLVFEADAAAIVHLMDPPDLFPYKQPQMRKVFDAFDTMLRRRASAAAMAHA